MVSLKFKVTEIHRSMGARYVETEKGRELVPCEIQTIRLQPTINNQPTADEFWASTPRGQIEISCVNVAAAGFLDLGREFDVEFHAAV